MRRARHVERIGDTRNIYKISVGKPEGKRPFGSYRHRWEDNILEWVFGKQGGKLWIVFIWLRIVTSGRLL
jgi:hypothetical protein